MKILDFGLAKMSHGEIAEGASVDQGETQVFSDELTSPGGTAETREVGEPDYSGGLGTYPVVRLG